MNGFDYAVVAVIGISLLVGAWRGGVSELLSVMAWVVAIVLGWVFCWPIGQVFYARWFSDPLLQRVLGFATIFLAVFMLAALMRYALRELLRAVGLGGIDRVFGAVFGVVRGVAVVLLCTAALLAVGVQEAPWWRQSSTAPWIVAALQRLEPWLPRGLIEKLPLPREII
ncbi:MULTISPECIES: CvpA family protein [Tepidiphilus]|uniref:CvpA family protein n=1 Tax=Tepidiphilus baoligensis TaxID=2698687 RepID=A0ABX1QIK7_9PROT|nr:MULTISPECIES: CvpA family protein [Tepidiphilus]NMH15812.1 CvpA family protein [Tepidiphilus baoligensis]